MKRQCVSKFTNNTVISIIILISYKYYNTNTVTDNCAVGIFLVRLLSAYVSWQNVSDILNLNGGSYELQNMKCKMLSLSGVFGGY